MLCVALGDQACPLLLGERGVDPLDAVPDADAQTGLGCVDGAAFGTPPGCRRLGWPVGVLVSVLWSGYARKVRRAACWTDRVGVLVFLGAGPMGRELLCDGFERCGVDAGVGCDGG